VIRRDYVLRMIEEFIRALSRIRSLRQDRRLAEASAELDAEFLRLIKTGPKEVAKLSETELLARLIQGEPTQAVRDKTLLLTTLLKEAGDLAVVEARPDEARDCYFKGLHLLLEASRGEVFDLPEFVPTIEMFVTALADFRLPLETQARLMQHYESAGEFSKAEDLLFAMLEAAPSEERLLDFGLTFYDRMKTQSDAALEAGNLPRAEVVAGLAELNRRRGGDVASRPPRSSGDGKTQAGSQR
jgi:hypothetical protein